MYTLYTKPNCPFCYTAKKLLISKKQLYTIVEIGKDLSREDFVSKYPDVKSVPYITRNNVDDDMSETIIGGYRELSDQLNRKE